MLICIIFSAIPHSIRQSLLLLLCASRFFFHCLLDDWTRYNETFIIISFIIFVTHNYKVWFEIDNKWSCDEMTDRYVNLRFCDRLRINYIRNSAIDRCRKIQLETVPLICLALLRFVNEEKMKHGKIGNPLVLIQNGMIFETINDEFFCHSMINDLCAHRGRHHHQQHNVSSSNYQRNMSKQAPVSSADTPHHDDMLWWISSIIMMLIHSFSVCRYCILSSVIVCLLVVDGCRLHLV